MTRRLSVRTALTQDRFRAWLEAKENGATVGLCNAMYTCPLAVYLSETLGRDLVRVTDMVTLGYNARPSTQLPTWAYAFERAVDGLVTGPGWATRQPPITREVALRLLGEVTG
jgi:hypothetical protein